MRYKLHFWSTVLCIFYKNNLLDLQTLSVTEFCQIMVSKSYLCQGVAFLLAKIVMACTSNFDHVMNMQNTHAYHVLNFFQAQYSSQLRKKWCMSLKNRSQFLVEYKTVRSLNWSVIKLYCTGKKNWFWEQLVAWLFSLHRSFSCLLGGKLFYDIFYLYFIQQLMLNT